MDQGSPNLALLYKLKHLLISTSCLVPNVLGDHCSRSNVFELIWKWMLFNIVRYNSEYYIPQYIQILICQCLGGFIYLFIYFNILNY